MYKCNSFKAEMQEMFCMLNIYYNFGIIVRLIVIYLFCDSNSVLIMRQLLFCILLFFCFANTYPQGVNQLWGMTQGGASEHTGSILSTSATGDNLQLRHEFKYSTAGALPQYMELVEYNNKFYGLTGDGGINDFGVLFEWDPVTDIYIKKHDFATATGRYPYGSLTLNNGKLYGTTQYGGTNSTGVIFEYDPLGDIYTKKIDFDGINGSYPFGRFTEFGGKLYGMTNQGGVNNAGVIFEWDPANNVYTKKIDLSNSLGRSPYGNLLLSGGLFYGMTLSGGASFNGVIFEWNPITNVYTKKIDLTTINGSEPYGSFAEAGGKFYGMTRGGGNNSQGVIFEWDPVTNIYSKKIDLDNNTGNYPYGNLTYYAGSFYGMMYSGGANGNGTLFEWNPATNIYSKKIDLNSLQGTLPKGTLLLYGGKFYGVTEQGGVTASGTLFEWDPSTNIFNKKRNFRHAINGQTPLGSFTPYNNKLYGLSVFGGANDQGVIFEYDLSLETYTKKYDFSNADGKFPRGNLAVYGGKFYGSATQGGSTNEGVLFEWDPLTNVYTKKLDLSNSLGSYPTGYLYLYSGKYYGMTSDGGGGGAIFEWDPVLNVYTKKVNFQGSNGNNPKAGLTFYNGIFYGVTRHGGANSNGVIFEWNPVTNLITKKIDLSVSTGFNPSCNLIMYNNKFYGTTEFGGAGGGVIFEWDPVTNIYTKKFDFSAALGRNPIGSMTLSGGKFYGMAQYGGANGRGVLFEWDPITNIYTTKKDLNGIDGAFPQFNDLVLVQAPVAKGNLVSCQALPTVIIDATNNNTWVPIVDNLGDIAAEINANGNNLGMVSSSLFTKNGACREDNSNRLYLNRNITITPQTQPGSDVSVRLYIRKSELDTLRTAMNSMNQPSGVASINEVEVFKNDDACSSIGSLSAYPLTATSGVYNADYYLQINISSFSSFYFANKLLTVILPVKIKSFAGKKLGYVNELKWEAACNGPVNFVIERSCDGVHFEIIGNRTAIAVDCNQPFYFTDNNPFPKNNYYRLKINEVGGSMNYSSVILLDSDRNFPFQISVKPNIVKGTLVNLELTTEKGGQIELMITDVTGRPILNRQLAIQTGSSNMIVNAPAIASGIYWLYVVGKEGRSNVVRLVKQ